MIYLIDTCAFLWFVTDDKNLSANAKALIESDTAIYLSLASIWEMAIKFHKGRLEIIPPPFSQFLDKELMANGFVPLEIKISHIKKVANLPAYHNDPFDRLIIAQSLIEDFTVVTNDKQFNNYNVKHYW